jgi:hypothetical protein
MFYEVILPLLGMGMGMYAIVEGLRLGKRAMDQKHERDLAAVRGSAPGDLEDLRERVERLEEVGYRVQELEERMDFTERVLSSGHERSGTA